MLLTDHLSPFTTAAKGGKTADDGIRTRDLRFTKPLLIFGVIVFTGTYYRS